MFETTENTSEKIYIIKDLDLFPNAKLFEDHINAFINADHRNLVFDMKYLESIDSIFISIIIGLKTRLSIDGRHLRIINYNEHIYKCFRLLQLDEQLLC